MRASPFIKPLESAAVGWEQLLLSAQVRLVQAGSLHMLALKCKLYAASCNLCSSCQREQLPCM